MSCSSRFGISRPLHRQEAGMKAGTEGTDMNIGIYAHPIWNPVMDYVNLRMAIHSECDRKR